MSNLVTLVSHINTLANVCAVVVLTAHFVGNRFAKNVYDILMGTNS